MPRWRTGTRRRGTSHPGRLCRRTAEKNSACSDQEQHPWRPDAVRAPSPGGKGRPMNDFQAIADRVEIEALRGEFSDAVMMRDYGRIALLFTPDGALRMPNIPVELEGQEAIRAWG